MDIKKARIWYLVAACLLIGIVIFSIRWPGKNSALGESLTCHIYHYDSYKILRTAVGADGAYYSFVPDSHYDSSFTFEFDRESGSYIISEQIQGVDYYLCMNDEHELCGSESRDAQGSRWDVVRDGNSMYFFIVNASDDYAISRVDSSGVELHPFDANDDLQLMRLQ